MEEVRAGEIRASEDRVNPRARPQRRSTGSQSCEHRDTSLSLRRARATWLTAHLEAGTPAVTAEQAIAEALRA